MSASGDETSDPIASLETIAFEHLAPLFKNVTFWSVFTAIAVSKQNAKSSLSSLVKPGQDVLDIGYLVLQAETKYGGTATSTSSRHVFEAIGSLLGRQLDVDQLDRDYVKLLADSRRSLTTPPVGKELPRFQRKENRERVQDMTVEAAQSLATKTHELSDPIPGMVFVLNGVEE